MSSSPSSSSSVPSISNVDDANKFKLRIPKKILMSSTSTSSSPSPSASFIASPPSLSSPSAFTSHSSPSSSQEANKRHKPSSSSSSSPSKSNRIIDDDDYLNEDTNDDDDDGDDDDDDNNDEDGDIQMFPTQKERQNEKEKLESKNHSSLSLSSPSHSPITQSSRIQNKNNNKVPPRHSSSSSSSPPSNPFPPFEFSSLAVISPPPSSSSSSHSSSSSSSPPLAPLLPIPSSSLPFKVPEYQRQQIALRLDYRKPRGRTHRQIILSECYETYGEVFGVGKYYHLMSIKSEPSVVPEKHLCDITGLEGRYTDPISHLRYCSVLAYEEIQWKRLHQRESIKLLLQMRGAKTDEQLIK